MNSYAPTSEKVPVNLLMRVDLPTDGNLTFAKESEKKISYPTKVTHAVPLRATSNPTKVCNEKDRL